MSAPHDEQDLELVNLASARLGARALLTNDDFFAPIGNLLRDQPPIRDALRYTERGKWMDGWESRRRRTPGHDWCLVQLGLAGVPVRVVVDTAYFTGNFPEACSLEGCHAPGLPPGDLVDTPGLWHELLPRTTLQGDHSHVLDVPGARACTHLRLNIFPDGGVARLRVFGHVQAGLPELLAAPAPHDLASLALGGRVLGCSDAFFSRPQNLIEPGRSTGMHDGWETRRRRGPGHDWVVLSLGQPGRIEQVEVDTSFFKGNAPGRCSLHVAETEPSPSEHAAEPGGSGPWRTLLRDAPLGPHALHVFADELAGARRARVVRFDIHPDGGVARLRIRGLPDSVAALGPGLERLSALPEPSRRAALLDCCGSRALVDAVLAQWPYADAGALVRAADAAWAALEPDDWREAFAAHPEIGERASGSGRAARWSASEQSGAQAGDAELTERLAAGNRAYRARFGHVFLVCATGRGQAELLALLECRLAHDAATELAVAAEEQRRITTLRLIRLLEEA